jgi:hypothetical protein
MERTNCHRIHSYNTTASRQLKGFWAQICILWEKELNLAKLFFYREGLALEGKLERFRLALVPNFNLDFLTVKS